MKKVKSTYIVIAALALAACQGSDAAAPVTTIPAAKISPTTTSPKSTPTTEAATTTSSSTTSTTIPPDPVMPLTGLPIVDPALAARPAVVVKVSNDPGARPQSGLDSADIVFEAWGAGPTRFATVFQSKDAPNVGPIRSARTQDVDLVGSFNGAVFACSGGNARAIAAIRSSDLLVLTEGQGPGWRLDKNRHRPHATFSDPSDGFKLHIEAVNAEWHFDAASNSYARSQEGHPHLMADGTPVKFDNVVVLWIDYDHSPADARSPDGGTIGSGDAVVFTNGKVINAKWARDDRLKPIALTDATGAPVLLTPGTTWFELANTGQGSFPGTDQLEVLPA